jgi:hypothetical protein
MKMRAIAEKVLIACNRYALFPKVNDCVRKEMTETTEDAKASAMRKWPMVAAQVHSPM